MALQLVFDRSLHPEVRMVACIVLFETKPSVALMSSLAGYLNDRAVVGLMDRALDLKPEVTQGCGFESRLRQEVHDCSPGAAQSAAHCSKCVHAENTFHSSLYSV